jgi:hypothetical protein
MSGSKPGERRGGRKKGTPNKRPGTELRKSLEQMKAMTPAGIDGGTPGGPGDPRYRDVETPLELALLIMKDERLDLGIRFVAMKEAMPYVHSRMATQPYKPPDHDGRIFIEVVEFSEEDFE